MADIWRRVPQASPASAYARHRREIQGAIARVLESGEYILGNEVAAFEAEFAAYLGVPHAVGVANGTDAIECALRACGIGPGDLVYTVSHTAAATVAAVERCGATAIVVDIDERSYTMDPGRLEEALANGAPGGGRPAAIVPVHLYGCPADMEAICGVAGRYGLRVIEDCAQAHGARLRGRTVGSWGDLAAFSFYPTKNLGALGDGGMVVTRDRALWERLRMLRQYGWDERRVSIIPGINSRLDEVQAAVLRVKLRYLEEENDRRRVLAKRYSDRLVGCRVTVPFVPADARHVYHQYVVRTPRREELRRELARQGVSTAIHYPVPIHRQPAFHTRVPRQGLPRTDAVAGEVLSLPMYPQLEMEVVEAVADAILDWSAEGVRDR
jgi:dTDP-4-amino-4,6-dideoxygalactose transaminase